MPRVRHKVLRVRIVLNITDPAKCKDKLLRDESDWDEVSSLPIVEPSIDIREDPFLQVAAIFTIFHCVDHMVADL